MFSFCFFVWLMSLHIILQLWLYVHCYQESACVAAFCLELFSYIISYLFIKLFDWICSCGRRRQVYHWTLWTRWIALCRILTTVTGIQYFKQFSRSNFLIRSWLIFMNRCWENSCHWFWFILFIFHSFYCSSCCLHLISVFETQPWRLWVLMTGKFRRIGWYQLWWPFRDIKGVELFSIIVSLASGNSDMKMFQ